MGILESCITGLIFIIIGFVLRKYPPEHVNNSLGYSNNSDLSMKISLLGLFILAASCILCTELHLRKLFDKNGARKQ